MTAKRLTPERLADLKASDARHTETSLATNISPAGLYLRQRRELLSHIAALDEEAAAKDAELAALRTKLAKLTAPRPDREELAKEALELCLKGSLGPREWGDTTEHVRQSYLATVDHIASRVSAPLQAEIERLRQQLAEQSAPRQLTDEELEKLAEGARSLWYGPESNFSWEEVGDETREGWRRAVRFLAAKLPAVQSQEVAELRAKMEGMIDPRAIYDTFECPSCHGSKRVSTFNIDGETGEKPCGFCEESGFVSLAQLDERFGELRAKLEAAEQHLNLAKYCAKTWRGVRDAVQADRDRLAAELKTSQAAATEEATRGDRLAAELSLSEIAAGHLSAMVEERAAELAQAKADIQGVKDKLHVWARGSTATEVADKAANFICDLGDRSLKYRQRVNDDAEILQKQNFWRWHGDGHDFPESLTCQVVMTADQLRGMLAELDQAKRELADYKQGAAAEASADDEACAELSQARQHLTATRSKLDELVSECQDIMAEGVPGRVWRKLYDALSVIQHPPAQPALAAAKADAPDHISGSGKKVEAEPPPIHCPACHHRAAMPIEGIPPAWVCERCGHQWENHKPPAFVCPACVGTVLDWADDEKLAIVQPLICKSCQWIGKWADVRAARERKADTLASRTLVVGAGEEQK